MGILGTQLALPIRSFINHLNIITKNWAFVLLFELGLDCHVHSLTIVKIPVTPYQIDITDRVRKKYIVSCCLGMKWNKKFAELQRTCNGHATGRTNVKRRGNGHERISPDFVWFPSVSPVWYDGTGF